MTLIKSISGIRGTIGGAPGDALTPVDIVKFTYAYCSKLRERRPKAEGERYKVVVGKDARLSGEMVESIVCGTLISCGVDVVKAGFASTPTTEMAVTFAGADGGIIMPRLLKRLGVECVELNCEPTGEFAHNPEPLPANLIGLSEAVVREKADFGISVDPDVDRLALICEDGKPFGEEYTLVSVADYLLERAYNEALETGKSLDEVCAPYCLATSSNLSSSRALRDVTEKFGGEYFAAAVGEVNVTTKMKECGALIGGEGNGGVIYPALHYGRDAMVGVALFLSNLAHKKMSVSELRKTYPQYIITKNRIDLSDSSLIDKILNEVKAVYANENVNTIDGVKVSFEDRKEWVHLRRSNTEPIIRIYAEAATEEAANALAAEVIDIAKKIIG